MPLGKIRWTAILHTLASFHFGSFGLTGPEPSRLSKLTEPIHQQSSLISLLDSHLTRIAIGSVYVYCMDVRISFIYEHVVRARIYERIRVSLAAQAVTDLVNPCNQRFCWSFQLYGLLYSILLLRRFTVLPRYVGRTVHTGHIRSPEIYEIKNSFTSILNVENMKKNSFWRN